MSEKEKKDTVSKEEVAMQRSHWSHSRDPWRVFGFSVVAPLALVYALLFRENVNMLVISAIIGADYLISARYEGYGDLFLSQLNKFSRLVFGKKFKNVTKLELLRNNKEI